MGQLIVTAENQTCHQEEVGEGDEAGKHPWSTSQQSTKHGLMMVV
jgi:hypothetical protein